MAQTPPLQILLWGGRTKARLICHLLSLDYPDAGLFVYEPDANHEPTPVEVTVVSNSSDLQALFPLLSHYVVCIGGEHGFARWTASKFLRSQGLEPLSLMHTSSMRDETSSVGVGVQMMARSTLGFNSSIGDQSILNTSSTVDHDCTIGRAVHVMGSAAIASFVHVRDFATIGTNATLIPGISIGEGSFVGAGAVVLDDVPDFTLVVGNPARYLRDVPRPAPLDTIARMWPGITESDLLGLKD